MKVLVFLLLVTFSIPVLGQHLPVNIGHSHNDYHQKHPLKSALSLGYGSIEVDIYLIGNELYVSHNRPLVPNKKRTLRAMYLDPISKIYKKNDGRVFLNSNRALSILIDIKTDGQKTYEVLKKQLVEYRHLFNDNKGSVANKVIISGNIPLTSIFSDQQRIACVDGRVDDLSLGYHQNFMPIVSHPFTDITNWNGKSDISNEDLSKIRALIQSVHDENKKIRFWGIPDNQKSWRLLINEGVDIINTDNLEEFQTFHQREFGNRNSLVLD